MDTMASTGTDVPVPRSAPAEAAPARPVRHRGLLLALGVALAFHGGLLAAGSFRATYDAYVHIFFADHYAQGWFTTWEPRWYTGFTVTSYPPGAHQSVALLSKALGLEGAFVVVQTFAVLLLVTGIYRFARLWVDERSAGAAALLAALSSSVAETVHVFGQLPTTLSLGFLLNSLPSARRFIARGDRRAFAVGVAVTAATTAAHHVTTLFGSVFFLGPVVVSALVEQFRTPRPDETPGGPRRVTKHNLWPLTARRLRRVAPALSRAAVYGGSVLTALVVVVLPYWLWSQSDPITQIPIPHASRKSFLADLNAGLVFWLVPWGLLLLALPFAVVRGLRSRAWPLALSVLLLTLLGTGGTTPIPRMLLGGAFEILTLDRFTFWATIAVLPLAGAVVVSLVSGGAAAWVRANVGAIGLRAVQGALAAALVLVAVFCATLTHYRPFQPDRIDPDPIVAFIEKDQHWRWRYLTLGFGDQMAWLSAQTRAATVDGNYHSARRLPELVTTSVERLEGAKFRGVPGIGSLQQFLAVPEKYNLKFVFSNDRFYDPLLSAFGWHRLDRLENGVAVWEREDVVPLPEVLPKREIPGWQRLLWGILPLTTMAGAAAALTWLAGGAPLPRRVSRSWRRLERVAGGLGPRPVWRRLDRRLAAAAGTVGGAEDVPRWQEWRDNLGRLSARLTRPPGPTRRRLQVAGLALVPVMVAAVSLAVAGPGRPAGPGEVTRAYFEDLAFRRFDRAWARLDPATRPSYRQYTLERSVEGGLVASYSELGAVRTRVVYDGPDRAWVDTELDYLTALAEYPVTRRVEARLVGGRWCLAPPEPDVTIPPDQFFRRPGVDYFSQGRRRVTEETTSYGDVLDRPEIQVLRASLVREGDRYVVVGELRNTDVDPADVTVTARLRDADGATLALYNADQIIAHTLRPGESTPFRVEFEGVAGAFDFRDPTAGDFRPGQVTPLRLPPGAEVAGVDIYAKAVVTARGLDRPLTLSEVRVAPDSAGRWWIEGRVRNDGTVEATVGHLLATYYGPDGSVAWVDHAFLEQAVRPQREQEFRLPIPDPTTIRPTGGDTALFDNGLAAGPPTGAPPPPLPLPSGTGFASLRLQAVAFVAGGGG